MAKTNAPSTGDRGRGKVHHPLLDPRIVDTNVIPTYLTRKGRSWLRNVFSAAGVPMAHPMDHSYRSRARLMCLLCSNTAKRSNHRDSVTGMCLAKRACSERRKELDDETIEALGLIPRSWLIEMRVL